jgi:hypothetical protein
MLGVCARTFRRYIERHCEEGLEGLAGKRLTQASAAKGSSPGNFIASGNLTLKGNGNLADAGPHFPSAVDAKVPYEVQVRWELIRQ